MEKSHPAEATILGSCSGGSGGRGDVPKHEEGKVHLCAFKEGRRAVRPESSSRGSPPPPLGATPTKRPYSEAGLIHPVRLPILRCRGRGKKEQRPCEVWLEVLQVSSLRPSGGRVPRSGAVRGVSSVGAQGVLVQDRLGYNRRYDVEPEPGSGQQGRGGRIRRLTAFVPYTEELIRRTELRRNALLADVIQPEDLGPAPQQTLSNALVRRFGGYSHDFFVARFHERDFAILLPS